jgi:hypothetical protein
MVADEDYTLLKGKDWQPQGRLSMVIERDS